MCVNVLVSVCVCLCRYCAFAAREDDVRISRPGAVLAVALLEAEDLWTRVVLIVPFDLAQNDLRC